MTPKSRARIVLVALVAAAIGGVVLFRMQYEDALRAESEPAADASVDADATVAKAKPAANKKKKARGGKTHVAARAPSGGGGGAHTSGAHTASAHPGGAHEGSGHDDHAGGATTAAPTGGGAPRAHAHHAGPSGPSYESALDSNNQQLNMGAHAGADLTDAQLSAPMSDGTFVGDCGAPDDMGVTVKVAIKMGRPVGVSVSTSPHSADVAGCIDHYVRKLSWPVSPKLDSFVTTY
jgi:hypothetical protein